MPVLRIPLDNETFSALERRAQSERRPADWQAEVILRQSLGLPFPYINQPTNECMPTKAKDRGQKNEQ
jgi:hypothetical protein